jgi:two-component system cell cycle response regulator DivK
MGKLILIVEDEPKNLKLIRDLLQVSGYITLEAKTKAIPIIALTAQAMKGDEEKIWESGCDGYMPKPLDVKEFLRKVTKFLLR